MRVKGAPLLSPTPMVQGPWVNLWGGFTVAPDSTYGEVGTVFGLGHDLNTDGLLGRFELGGGSYEYNIWPGYQNSVGFVTADAMIGYQKFIGSTRISGYMG